MTMERRTLLQAILSFFSSLIFGLRVKLGWAAPKRLVQAPVPRIRGKVSETAGWKLLDPPAPVVYEMGTRDPIHDWPIHDWQDSYAVMRMNNPSSSLAVDVSDNEAMRQAYKDVKAPWTGKAGVLEGSDNEKITENYEALDRDWPA